MNFFAQLKERKVYRVAVVYAVVAWLLIQAASILFPTFEAPTWALKVFVVVVAAGFPLALILAWTFEITPKGIVRAEDVSPNERILWSRRKFGLLILSLVLVAGGLLLFQFIKDAGKDAGQSIAVLPFKDEAGIPLFAVGLLEDVLNKLASIKDLKVISRSSVMFYCEKVARTRREIGTDLGVSHILEGRVHLDGDRILLNVKLFDSTRDETIWEQGYHRTQAEILTLQSELALGIASALDLSLTPAEKARLGKNLTANMKAWVSYHEGREIQLRHELSKEDYLSATDFYKKAVDLDPKFVLARARLSFMQVILYQMVDPGNALFLADARKNADTAFTQDADSAEAHLALARCALLEGKRDRIRAELAEAVRLLPNDASLRLSERGRR